MKTIAHILSRYSAYLWALLQPLGAYGVLAIAIVDSSFFGMPLDAVVAAYVYQQPHLFWLYTLMAAAGSALGSLVIYFIGYKGGEALLRKRMSPQKFEKIHRSFDSHPFLALMVPAILPPPTPFKLFVLAAAVGEMRIRSFLSAIFAGRTLRFLLLSYLTVKFGPQVVHLTGELLRQHAGWVVGVVLAACAVWLIRRTIRRKPEELAPGR